MTGKQSISSTVSPNPSTLLTESSFDFLSEREKRRLCLNRINHLKSLKPKFLHWKIFFISSNWFFESEHPFIDKSMFIIELALPSARLFGLGPKLYPAASSVCSSKKVLLDSCYYYYFFLIRRIRVNESKALLTG